MFGFFLTFSIFGTLNSTNFINKWITTENPLDHPIMDLSTAHLVVAALSLTTLVFILFTVSEKEVKRASCCELLKLMPKFFTNRWVLGWILFIMLKFFASNLFGAVYTFKLIELGFSYDYIIILGTLFMPLGIIVTVICGKWLVRGKNQKMSIIMSIPTVLSGIGSYVLLCNYHGPKDDHMMIISMCVLNVVFCFSGMSFIYDSGFLNDVADEKIGGIYITFIASFMNLSGMLPETLGLYVVSHVNFDYYCIFSLT